MVAVDGEHVRVAAALDRRGRAGSGTDRGRSRRRTPVKSTGTCGWVPGTVMYGMPYAPAPPKSACSFWLPPSGGDGGEVVARSWRRRAGSTRRGSTRCRPGTPCSVPSGPFWAQVAARRRPRRRGRGRRSWSWWSAAWWSWSPANRRRPRLVRAGGRRRATCVASTIAVPAIAWSRAAGDRGAYACVSASGAANLEARGRRSSPYDDRPMQPLLGSIPSPSNGNLGPFHMYGIILAVGVLVGGVRRRAPLAPARLPAATASTTSRSGS